MAQCAHLYGSGERCVYMGCDKEGDKCPAHTHLDTIEQAQRRYKERKAAARSKRAPKPKPVPPPPPVESVPPPIGAPRDPSAPYCTCVNATADHEPCTSCGKPHFMDWRETVSKRIKEAG